MWSRNRHKVRRLANNNTGAKIQTRKGQVNPSVKKNDHEKQNR